ncbi:MAG TPA: hypothetical protein PLL23_03590 [Chitinophagaceae bacterium]|nr:hypothetical protein [Chitinophagaceae bacterium]
MKQSLFVLLFSFSIFFQYSHAQVTTVKSPALNQPILKMPAGLPAKIKQVDSLKKAHFSAGQILKTYIPKYGPQFQQEMTENLIVMYHSGFKTGELADGVKTQYPEIRFPVVFRIFYTALKEIRTFGNSTTWIFTTSDTLKISYGLPVERGYVDYPHFYIKTLKDGGASVSDIFYFIDKYMVTGSPANWQNIENNVKALLQSGFKEGEILRNLLIIRERAAWIFTGFCKGAKSAGVDAVTTSRVLNIENLTKDEISNYLKNGGYTAGEILAALQAL